MTPDQYLKRITKENLITEFNFLKMNKAAILQEVSSNRLSIENQFIAMELMLSNALADVDDLIEMDMSLTKINTYIAMAFLNAVEDNEVEFKYLTRLTSLFFKLHLNKLSILRSITIDGRYNYLTSLPPEIGFLLTLEKLDLNHCALHTLPPEIGLLRSLHNINLDYNEIESIPAEIAQIRDLEELHLRHNHLKELPEALNQLAHLRSIDIQENDITTLPTALSKYIH